MHYIHLTGCGAISGIQITHTSFQSDPPTFTLLGATSGGPPTTYTWTRNGLVITNSASYSISIQVERSNAGFKNSRYHSTLTVTGRLPGVYRYSVTNRATSGMVNDTFTIESKNSIMQIADHLATTAARYPVTAAIEHLTALSTIIQVVHLLLMSQLSRMV